MELLSGMCLMNHTILWFLPEMIGVLYLCILVEISLVHKLFKDGQRSISASHVALLSLTLEASGQHRVHIGDPLMSLVLLALKHQHSQSQTAILVFPLLRLVPCHLSLVFFATDDHDLHIVLHLLVFLFTRRTLR